MKNFTIFLVALITLLCTVPADAQRRKREAEKQKTTQKQTTNPNKPTQRQKGSNLPSSSRREKRLEPKIPDVPCTLTLDEAPTPRGFAFGQTLSSIRDRFARSQVGITGKDMPLGGATPFVQQYSLYSTSAALKGFSQPGDNETATFNSIKEINLYFYGATNNPILFGYDFLYVNNLTFDSTQQIKEMFLKNFSIPVGSWTPFSEDRNSTNDWRARCKGWRTYFATSVDNTGLYFSATNTDVESNLDTMKRDADKKKTDEIFKP